MERQREEIEVSKDVAAANLLWRDQKTAHELELIRIRKRQERDLKAMAAAIRRGDIPPPVWPLAQVLRGSTAPAQIGAHVANVLGRASEDMQAIGASPRLPSQGSGVENDDNSDFGLPHDEQRKQALLDESSSMIDAVDLPGSTERQHSGDLSGNFSITSSVSKDDVIRRDHIVGISME